MVSQTRDATVDLSMSRTAAQEFQRVSLTRDSDIELESILLAWYHLD